MFTALLAGCARMEHPHTARCFAHAHGTGIVRLKPLTHARGAEGVPTWVDKTVRGVLVAQGTSRSSLGTAERVSNNAATPEVVSKRSPQQARHAPQSPCNVKVHIVQKDRDVRLEPHVCKLRKRQDPRTVAVGKQAT